MTVRNQIMAFVTLLAAVGCGGSTGDSSSMTPVQDSRIFGLDVKEVPSVTYAMAYDRAMAMGAREVSVSLDWATLEPIVGNYDDTLPGTINTFFPFQPGDFTLVLRPLDTQGSRLPADLAGLPFDNPVVISAFCNFLTHLHGQLSDLNTSGKLRWIHVGNEIDASLANDTPKWLQWKTFFNAAKTRIESLWGEDTDVSSIIRFSALNNINTLASYLDFLPDLDSAVLTYYPLNPDFTVRPLSTVSADFDFVVSTITDKPVIFQECGYPSSSVNMSSETLQADFITAVFDAWDTHHDRINLIELSWQYDVSQATVNQWVVEYNMGGHPNVNEFKHYLRSLGLSNYDSSQKLALQRLRKELQIREWQ